MKDNIQLLVAALPLATVGWAFWHFTGEQGFGVLSLFALVVAVADNIRLRRLLRASRRL